jgi:hypothetical protein
MVQSNIEHSFKVIVENVDPMKQHMHMNRLAEWLIDLLWKFFTFAQQASPEGANSITIPGLKDHMYYLASDELNGRLPGTPGYEKAVEYAVTQFIQSGIVHLVDNGSSFLQPIPLQACYWDEKNELILENNPGKSNFKMGTDFIILSGNPNETKQLHGEMVFVSLGIHEPGHGLDNYKGIEAIGKWVIMYSEEYLEQALKEKLPPDICMKYKLRHTGQSLRERYAREPRLHSRAEAVSRHRRRLPCGLHSSGPRPML